MKVHALPAIALVALLCPSLGYAREHSRARLVVVRAPSANDCPDEKAIGNAVGARLGYEAFGASATTEIRVTYDRQGDTLRGRIQLRDAAGEIKGERALTSSHADCEELSSATTLTISILLDPRSGLVPPPPPDPVLVPDPAPLVPVPPDPDRARHDPPAPTDPIRLRITGAATVSAGTAPAPAFGFLLGVGVEQHAWSMSAELRADLPASDANGAFAPRAHFIGGNAVPCFQFWHAYGCGVLSLGALAGEVGGAAPSHQSTFHAMVGPRVGVAIPLVGILQLDAHLEGQYALTTTTLRVADSDLWTSSSFAALAAIGIAGRFP